MGKKFNPFVLQGYAGKKYFCDREDELEELGNHVQNGRNIVLYAWRRLGKSALIKRYLGEAERNKQLEAVYVDLMATTTADEAIEAIVDAVYQRFGKTSSGFSNSFQKLLASLGFSVNFDPTTSLPSFSLNYNQHTRTETSLSEIGKFLSERTKQVVIAMDEFQQVSKYDGQKGEAVFRSFMQQFPAIRFIFSGSHRQMMTTMFSDKSRPFYASCQLISLDPIPMKKYSVFIKKHFRQADKEIEDIIIEDIYDWSMGQTYTMQLLCNGLYAQPERPTREILEGVKSRALEQNSPIYSNYANILTRTQWQTLKAIARENRVKNPMSKAFLLAHNLGAASSVSSALKMLIDKEIVVKQGSEYFVHETLFGRWLERL